MLVECSQAWMFAPYFLTCHKWAARELFPDHISLPGSVGQLSQRKNPGLVAVRYLRTVAQSHLHFVFSLHLVKRISQGRNLMFLRHRKLAPHVAYYSISRIKILNETEVSILPVLITWEVGITSHKWKEACCKGRPKSVVSLIPGEDCGVVVRGPGPGAGQPGLSSAFSHHRWDLRQALCLSRPQFPHLKNGCVNNTNLIGPLRGAHEFLQCWEKSWHSISVPEAAAHRLSSRGPPGGQAAWRKGWGQAESMHCVFLELVERAEKVQAVFVAAYTNSWWLHEKVGKGLIKYKSWPQCFLFTRSKAFYSLTVEMHLKRRNLEVSVGFFFFN